MEPLKNNLSPQLVSYFSYHLSKHIKDFNKKSFEQPILNELPDLELKARAQLIADHLHHVLPASYQRRYKIILAILHPYTDMTSELGSSNKGIRGWGMMPLGMVVGQHGTDAFDDSLLLLKEMTKRFSSEFEVRYFLLADQARTIEVMRGWINDSSLHVRRLVSEGTRPRLPWAMQLPALVADPAPMLPLLEALRDDKEEYVRRSVANHLNDIAKDHPDLVANITTQWMVGADKNRIKLLRHACRTLIKQGHIGVLAAFGLHSPELKLSQLQVETPKVIFGDSLTFNADLLSTSSKSQDLVIDYLVHFIKANGKRVAKVFKWKKLTLEAGQAITLSKIHTIRPITTRRYYNGLHAVSLRINGEDYGLAEFMLCGAE